VWLRRYKAEQEGSAKRKNQEAQVKAMSDPQLRLDSASAKTEVKVRSEEARGGSAARQTEHATGSAISPLPHPERSTTMTEKTTKPVTELFEQAMKNYEQALKTGLKLQEESSKWWSSLMSQASSPQDWQKRGKTIADNFIPETQKRTEEYLKVIEQSSRASVELLKSAVQAAQSTSVQEAQTKFLSFWEASLHALRDTAQAVTQANAKAVESWMEFLRKGSEPVEVKAKA
jgi:hypothetical protein